jgi:mono/diheme cytochrome c family protein
MTVSNKMLGFGRLMLLAAVGFLPVAPTTAPAAENEAATGAEANAEVPVTEIKKLFANNCSWCHGAYGMTADKGPRLAGTKMTEEEVRERVRHGKEGYMPPFAKVLTDPQIAAFAKYIKSLTPAD